MIQTDDGNIYGSTFGTGNGTNGNGTVFELSCDGTSYRNVYAFTGAIQPREGVIEGIDGNFYGVVQQGAAPLTNGAVYRLSRTGRFEILHTFVGSDGKTPGGPLVQGSDGSLYGTTFYGGMDAGNGFGTVFKVDAGGSFRTLYDFGVDDGAISGANPRSRLVLDADGTLYGTTDTKGQLNSGTVFKIDSSGAFAVVAAFGGANGRRPHDLLLARNGMLYGRALGGQGIIFELSKQGALSVLHALTGLEGNIHYSGEDNRKTGGALIEGSDGSLYGTAETGGATDDGTAFVVRLDGQLELLYSFKGTKTDGAKPWGILEGKDKNLYGTFWGGTTNGGIFKISMPDGATTPECGSGTTGDAGVAADDAAADSGEVGLVNEDAGIEPSETDGSPGGQEAAGDRADAGTDEQAPDGGEAVAPATKVSKGGGCALAAPGRTHWRIPSLSLLGLLLAVGRRRLRSRSAAARTRRGT